MGTEKLCLFDGRWKGSHGIARFSTEVTKRIAISKKQMHGPWSPSFPIDPLWVSLQITLNQPAVYFSPGYNPPIASKIPFVFTIHDLNHLDILENTSRLKRLYYKYIIAPACKRAFKIFTVSEFSRIRIMEWSGIEHDKIINVGNGIGDEFAPGGNRHMPGYQYYLYVGSQKKHKNLENLLRAFAKAKIPADIKLILSGFPLPHLSALAEYLGIFDRIVYVGIIDDEELPSYYRGATALVLPSLYEGFGLPIAEAMACGVSVITSNRASMPEVAGDAGYLVDPESVSSITLAIENVFNNEEERKNKINIGLAHVKKYTWEKTANIVNEVLLQAIGI